MRRILGAIAASLLVVALVAVSVQKRKTLKESFVERCEFFERKKKKCDWDDGMTRSNSNTACLTR
jgi:hypothetical protein